MMVELVPPGESRNHRVVKSVIETLLAGNTVLPPHVLIDDGDRSWQRYAAALPVEVRRRSALVTASEASLVDALSFEIGGAARLPVSTPSMEAACEAASILESLDVAPMATQGVLDALRGDLSELLVVGWRPQEFWRRQVGPIRQVRWLVEIAERLTVIPMILPGPILVVMDRSRAEIEAALGDAGGGPGFPSFPSPPTMVELSASNSGAGDEFRIDRILAVAAAGGHVAGGRPQLNHPVLEIPSGRTVGQWSLKRGTVEVGSPWGASPRTQDRVGSCWEIISHDGSSEMIAESTSLDSDDVAGQSLIRAPGFAGAALRRGSPAGLLIEGMACHSARAGRPIWVPSVDGEGVRLLLGLPGPIWVDGPGVPR
jgi:hypothetical protein